MLRGIEKTDSRKDINFRSSLAKCLEFKSNVEAAKGLGNDEKTWLIKILQEQIDCFTALNAIDEKRFPTSDAEVKLQKLYNELLVKISDLQKFAYAGLRSNGNSVSKEFQNALVQFSKQKSITDKLINDCDASNDKFTLIKECQNRMDRLLADEGYSRRKSIYGFLKTKEESGLVEKMFATSIIISASYSEALDTHNKLKARIKDDPFREGLQMASEALKLYNALPALSDQKPNQSQVKVLNQTGAFKTATATTSTPQPDRRRAIAANSQ